MKLPRVLTPLAIFALLSTLGQTASATDTVSFDGTWWNSLDRNDQLASVQGMLVGYDSGYLVGFDEGLDADDPYVGYTITHASKAQREPLIQATRDIIKKQVSDVGSNISFGTIADRISAVYRDNPDVISTEVHRFFRCSASLNRNCQDAIKKARSSN